MGLNETEQIKIEVFARPNRPTYGYCPDQTVRNNDINQSEQNKKWVLTRQKDRNMGFKENEQTTGWVFPRPNKPNYGL